MSAPGELSEFEQKIIANVRDHGCHINYIFDRDDGEPAFAYSAGFHETLNQPEIIVFGLPREVMQFMINETLRQCRAGLRLEDGGELRGLLEGHRCILCEVLPEHITRNYFNSAIWFRRFTTGETMDRAFQIVWPGAQDGLFPWEVGCSGAVRDLQPCLCVEEE